MRTPTHNAHTGGLGCPPHPGRELVSAKDAIPACSPISGKDSGNDPSGLANAMETLWDYAEKPDFTDEQLQQYLDQLAD